MAIIQPSRRGLLIGLASLIAAPAIVRIDSLMKISVLPEQEMIMAIFDPTMQQWQAFLAQAQFELAKRMGIPAELFNGSPDSTYCSVVQGYATTLHKYHNHRSNVAVAV